MFIQARSLGYISIGVSAALIWLVTGLLAHAETSAKTDKDLVVEQNMTPSRKPHGPHGPVVVSLIPVGPSVLKVGMPIGFTLTSSATGYAHLYALDASGKSQVWLENVPIRARKAISYPKGRFVVRASPPSGDETIVFVVSRRPIHGFAGNGMTLIPFDAQTPASAFQDALADRLKTLPREDWVSTETHLRVED